MSSSPYDGASSPENQQERPQPRYGAYAPKSEQTADENPGASDSGAPYNPYGEPTWGQPGGTAASSNPYGEPPKEGHGQRSEADSVDGSPPQGHQALPERPKRPGTLWAALILLLGAAVTSLTWGIYVLATLPMQTVNEAFGGGAFAETFQDELERQAAEDPELQDLTSQQLEETLLFGIGLFALGWAAFLFAVYITLAFVGSMAGNPGRIIATIWCGLSPAFLLLGHNGASYGIIAATIACSAAAVVMMWLPASSEYIRHRRWEKEVRRSAYYGGGHPGAQPPTR
ncbi:hypothetical protein [Nesterenkonia ebinurensis]|uniref:hypothetical protein n=1 Tax=Nesterenkonia ebinurensis TaxID=2608252 RepID=UPI00123E222A|nr:hypothetical protein [Nesterenkonia ebinurensis]